MSDSEYISRDAVDTKLLAMEERFIDNPFALTAIAMAMDVIDKITAADVAPVVHGYWETYACEDGFVCAVCSICKWSSEAMWWGYVIKHFDFCPHCGVKMDESEE